MMNRDQIETLYGAFFDELSEIEKEAMEREALLKNANWLSTAMGAVRSVPGRVAGAAKGLSQGITGATGSALTHGGQFTHGFGSALREGGQAIGQAYRGAGGGMKGIGAALQTPAGAMGATALGGGLALGTAGGLGAGYLAGRGGRRQ